MFGGSAEYSGVRRRQDPCSAGVSANPSLVTAVNFPSWLSWPCQGWMSIWAEIHDPCERDPRPRRGGGVEFCQAGFVRAQCLSLGILGEGDHLDLDRPSRNIKMKHILPSRITTTILFVACLDEAWYFGLAFRRQCRPTNMPGFSRANEPMSIHGRMICEMFMLLPWSL